MKYFHLGEELDITNLSEVKAVIEKVMPSTIIVLQHTNVEKAELEPNVCESVNKGGVSNPCNVCEVFDINRSIFLQIMFLMEKSVNPIKKMIKKIL